MTTTPPIRPRNRKKERRKDSENRALIRWIGSGEAFRIYPYHAATGRMEWLSLSGRRPSQMPVEQWRFMLRAMPDINDLLMQGRNNAANDAITRLIDGQRLYAGEGTLPPQGRFRAELFYNSYIRLLPAAILTLLFEHGAYTAALRGGHRATAALLPAPELSPPPSASAPCWRSADG